MTRETTRSNSSTSHRQPETRNNLKYNTSKKDDKLYIIHLSLFRLRAIHRQDLYPSFLPQLNYASLLAWLLLQTSP